MNHRKWELMVWLCREIHSSDPDFKEKGGEDEESIIDAICGFTLKRSGMFLLMWFVVLGILKSAESILYYWRML